LAQASLFGSSLADIGIESIDTLTINTMSMKETVSDLRNRVDVQGFKRGMSQKFDQMSEEEKRISKMIKAASEKAPPSLTKYIQAAAHALAWAWVVLAALLPIMVLAIEKAVEIYRTLPQDIVSAIAGFLMCFTGGTFPTVIAAAEAFTQTGWKESQEAIGFLWDELHIIAEESKKDDDVDADGDGIKDVNQITGSELITRKTLLILRKTHADKINRALGSLYVGFLSVAATLKVQFARTISLGVSIGNVAGPVAETVLVPPLTHLVPKDYHHWIRPVIEYICKAVAVSIAWWIQRILSAYHSAIRGALMCTRALLRIANEKNWYSTTEDKTMLDEYAGWALAAFGFMCQMYYGFALPFPVDLFLLPVTILEYWIQWTITE